jgi:hypothetical protein
MAGKATRHLHKAREVTADRLEYLNKVRQYLLHLFPDGTVIIDYTRSDANEENHDIWVNNAIGAERNYLYRAYREWSMIRRGIEELSHSIGDIRALMEWAVQESHRYRNEFDRAETIPVKRYWANFLVGSLYRQESWTLKLTPWIAQAESFLPK